MCGVHGVCMGALGVREGVWSGPVCCVAASVWVVCVWTGRDVVLACDATCDICAVCVMCGDVWVCGVVCVAVDVGVWCAVFVRMISARRERGHWRRV